MSIYFNSFSFVPGDIEHNAKQYFQKEVWAAELFVAAKQLTNNNNNDNNNNNYYYYYYHYHYYYYYYY